MILATGQNCCNVYLFDDWLPTAEGKQWLLVDQLREHVGIKRLRVWEPNLKKNVVTAHRTLAVDDWLTAAQGCWHATGMYVSLHIDMHSWTVQRTLGG